MIGNDVDPVSISKCIPFELPSVDPKNRTELLGWIKFREFVETSASMPLVKVSFEDRRLQTVNTNGHGEPVSFDDTLVVEHPLRVADGIRGALVELELDSLPELENPEDAVEENVGSMRERIEKTVFILFQDPDWRPSEHFAVDEHSSKTIDPDAAIAFRNYCRALTHWLEEQDQSGKLMPAIVAWAQ